MAILTAQDFANQMVAQARILDPSISLEIGTPERKLIDTVAKSLADNQVDLTGLASALDVDSKFGSGLDRFTALFGFQRQQSIAATGYVEFSRNTPAPATITIPTNTVLQSTVTSGGLSDQSVIRLQFTTTATGQIDVNDTTSNAVPIRCVVTGAIGNVPANTITIIVGSQVPPGVTAVTNPNPLTNGFDQEDDNSYKSRFKNTWARNLAGTEDQYLALSLAGAVTTKANVIGAQSRFREYFQAPDYDDAGYLNGALTSGQITYGVQNQWTTALASIPYAKQIYTTAPVFLSNGQSGTLQYFYRPGSDFQFNYPPLLTGDTLRESPTTTVTSVVGTTVNVVSAASFASTGSFIGRGSATAPYSPVTITYTGKTSTSLTGCGGTLTALTNGDSLWAVPSSTVQPNYTFLNVFSSSITAIPGLQAIAPGNVLLGEFSYVSSASRNDMVHGVNNAVDVYVDGANDVTASTVFLPNLGTNQFTSNPNSPWYYENYRRDGQPTKRPQLNNYITPLFQSPVDSLPASITITNQDFYLGTHYWLVHEIDQLNGTIRARDGIEWNGQLAGDTAGGTTLPGTNDISPQAPYSPGGSTLVSLTGDGVTPIDVDAYQYDANIVTLQANMEASKQVTTDVLVHKAKMRYLKLDVTLVYSSQANISTINSAIATTVQAYFNRQFFGSVIELSTLLEIIHEVSGVENVRWSNDLPLPPDYIRVYECDALGNPVHGISVDRWIFGSASTVAVQTLYLAGNPNGASDTFTLSWNDTILNQTFTTAPISFYNSSTGAYVSAATIQSAIQSVAPGSGVYHLITVTEDSRPTTNAAMPIRSFSMTYGSVGQVFLPVVTNNITASSLDYNQDFYLLDDELPSLPIGQVAGDTLPGLILRVRSQNTLFRPGLG